MKLDNRELKILEEHFKIYENDEDYELEAWTDGGVDMFICLQKTSNFTLIELLEFYIEDFDIDEEIDLHRQDNNYRNNFKITESVKDFENWLEFVKGVIKELKEVE